MLRIDSKRALCLIPVAVCVVLAALWAAEGTRRVQVSSVSASAPAVAGTQAAVKYRWGKAIAGDEFNYEGRPSARKWRLYNGAGHAGRGRRAPSAWRVDGSVATVQGNSSGTTGGMSARFGSQRYGRWETRMRTTTRDPEYHPVLLLWPDEPVPSRCPEVDYAESSRDVRLVKFFLHYGCRPLQTRASRRIDMTRWHNYAVQWTSRSVTGYIDGVKWFQDTTPSHIPKTSMHQTIQLDWFPDRSATRRSAMMVDWVRVYRAG